MIEFLRIAHVSSTVDSWCFIGSVVTFALNKRTLLHYERPLTESKLIQNCRSYYERPFLHRHFSMKIDGIFKNFSSFIDYRLLMLYGILLNLCIKQEDTMHYLTALTESKSVQKCRSYYEWPFLHRHFSLKIDRIFRNCSCFIDYRLLMLYGILLNLCI